MRELTFRPSLLVRAAYTVLFAVLALMFLAGLKDIPPRGVGDSLMIAIALVCFYAAITYPMRAVTFTEGAVRVRTLGVWKTMQLPAKVRLRPGLSFGSLYLMDVATDTVLLILKREFGPVNAMRARIEAWLRHHGRLAP